VLTCKRSMAERSHEVKGVKKTGKEREKYREREREEGRWREREFVLKLWSLYKDVQCLYLYIHSSLCISLTL
jgi:hypothetical protein